MPFLPKLLTNVHISVWCPVPVRDVIWVFWLGQQMALFPLGQAGPGGGHASPGQLFKQVPFSISLAITPNQQFGHFGALCQYLWWQLASCALSLVSIVPNRQKARYFLCCIQFLYKSLYSYRITIWLFCCLHQFSICAIWTVAKTKQMIISVTVNAFFAISADDGVATSGLVDWT